MQLHSAREIAILVRSERQRQRLSQGALAARIGASRQWVQKLEIGGTGLELGLVLRALSALGIALDARPTGGPPVTVNAADERAVLARRAARRPNHQLAEVDTAPPGVLFVPDIHAIVASHRLRPSAIPSSTGSPNSAATQDDPGQPAPGAPGGATPHRSGTRARGLAPRNAPRGDR